MEKINLSVEGMSCDHCVKAITESVSLLNGVGSVNVSLADKLATITYNPEKLRLEEIKAVIEDEGYSVV